MAILLKSMSGRTPETLELRQLEVKELLQLILLELRTIKIHFQTVNDEEVEI